MCVCVYIYIYNGILLRLKYNIYYIHIMEYYSVLKGNPAICNSMGKPGKHSAK